MRLFCREDHNLIIEETSYEQELLEARAHLAKLKVLPLSVFAEKSYKRFSMTPYGPTSFQVDNKDDAIARAEAEIARLEVMVKSEPQANGDLVKGAK